MHVVSCLTNWLLHILIWVMSHCSQGSAIHFIGENNVIFTYRNSSCSLTMKIRSSIELILWTSLQHTQSNQISCSDTSCHLQTGDTSTSFSLLLLLTYSHLSSSPPLTWCHQHPVLWMGVFERVSPCVSMTTVRLVSLQEESFCVWRALWVLVALSEELTLRLRLMRLQLQSWLLSEVREHFAGLLTNIS